MPEGDTIYRTAKLLHTTLAGHTVVGFESAFPKLTRIDHDHPLAGRTIDSIESRGKHLLFFFSGDLILHTHMRMNGVWHVYPVGARWRRPSRDMRIAIATADAVAVGFTIPVAEFLTRRDFERHEGLQALGPDLLADSFDRAVVLARMRAQKDEPIADVLLNQRVVAGIGNVFKSEILFAAAVSPFARTSELPDAVLERVIDVARKQLRMNVVDERRSLAPSRGRRTTNSLHPGKGLWVYERSGEPCRKCGTAIRFRKTGVDARGTYWCPRCQKSATTEDTVTDGGHG
jgi:endonuclease-8